MNPAQFIAKWRHTTLSERSAAQQHFLDLCDLVGHPKPAEIDATGESFCFERGAARRTGGDGWADVWKRGYFGWEYKGKHKDLEKAYHQLLQYREDLESPPLLVVSDMDRIIIHTNFTATATQLFTIPLRELGTPRNLEILHFLFHDPDRLRPVVTSPVITEEAARRLGDLAQALRDRGEDPDMVAPFLDRIIFCLFVEDISILPVRQGADSSPPLLTQMLRNLRHQPEVFANQLRQLFEIMATGGCFGVDQILHFDGDLFDASTVLTLTRAELGQLFEAAKLDWSKVEPSIFGTLFERGLDPAKRAQFGAHYTSREDIETLVDPVLLAPLLREWQLLRDEILESLGELPALPHASAAAPEKSRITREHNTARSAFTLRISAFMRKLRATTVLDPACGSGNFLYVALRKLKDLERDIIEFCLSHDIPGDALPLVGPHQMYGIEINTYAYHLAQLVVWIGHLQWMHAYGYGIPEPVLMPLRSNFQNQDAILDLTDPDHPREPTWPKVDVIIGNPPFLGGKLLRRELGDANVDHLFQLYKGRVPHEADLCCYWYERARTQIENGHCKRAGLLATQGIRGGANRKVLDRIKETGDIFFAESDRPWILDGANVHVSMVGFDNGNEQHRIHDGETIAQINANLSNTIDITIARMLAENANVAFMGITPAGTFDLADEEALPLLNVPNPHGRPNSDVMRPYMNGRDLNQRSRNQWTIDFKIGMAEDAASLYEAPFQRLAVTLKEARLSNKRQTHNLTWWEYERSRPELRNAFEGQERYLATCMVAKHRIYSWLPSCSLPANVVIVFARADDYFFGVLHSRFHEVWARAQGTQLRERESGFRYTPTSCFETFPFPWPPGHEPQDDSNVLAISAAAEELSRLRENWLNPPEWVKQEILEFPGSIDGPWARYACNPDARGIGTVRYPRLVPKDDEAVDKLKKRTLTNLYNQRPAWLDLAHCKLDAAVAAAYGLPVDLTDEQILEELLSRNLFHADQLGNA